MQRRAFIKDTGKLVVAISVFGSIRWNNGQFIGDTPTTTDVLGPYYRPGAPLRADINPPGFSGDLLHLSGTIFKEGGETPFENCLIEIWQCDTHQHYDNTSEDYLYRGAQKTDLAGKYYFITTQPVPYPVEEGSPVYRPAHIHMHISGKGQQDLITQIYFSGDTYIKDDLSAVAPTAMNRILTVTTNSQNEKQLRFDIIMAKEFKPGDNVFEKLVGLYKMNDKSMIEFYREGDLLFMKWNGQIREALSYKSNNEFSGGINNTSTAKFELLQDQTVKVAVHYNAPALRKEFDLEGIKLFKY
jgi:protocatechuate 3,4-dioxygenase beta subunit